MSNEYKKLILSDRNNNSDSLTLSSYDTNVVIKVAGTDKVVFKGKNKVIISGSQFTASKHFNIKPKIFTPSYNTVMRLDNSVNEPYEGEGIRKEELIYLFAVGVGGCGVEARQVYNVDYTKWIAPEDLVPFRYVSIENDLNNKQREKYFGRKQINDKVAYYFKAFENEPELKQCYLDGTPIDENIYISDRVGEVRSIVELSLKINPEECREFFIETIGLSDSKINTISLLSAWKKEIDGYVYYQDIRPVTKINFPNEQLINTNKGFDITYQLFY